MISNNDVNKLSTFEVFGNHFSSLRLFISASGCYGIKKMNCIVNKNILIFVE